MKRTLATILLFVTILALAMILGHSGATPPGQYNCHQPGQIGALRASEAIC